MRNRLLVGGAVLVVVAAVLVWVGLGWWHKAHRTAFAQALDLVPSETQRVSFTDWHAARERLGVTSLDTSGHDLDKWLSRAYDKDYSATSPSRDQSVALTKYFGFSAANARWEAYAQSEEGATDVIRMEDGVDFDEFAKTLENLGYKAPKSEDGVWNGGPDLLSTIDPEISPEFQYIALLRGDHLIVTSDRIKYAEEAAKIASGDGDSLADTVDGIDDLAEASGEPVAATLWSRDFACTDLSMTHAGKADQRHAAKLISEVGKTSALSGLVMAMSGDRVLTVAEQFESGDQARENLEARAKLAVGPAVGRGGQPFAEDYKMTSARTKGSLVVLTMKPRDPAQFPLSSVYDGAVIFATC